MDKLSEKAKMERASYMREYRKLHPEKMRDINRRYCEKRAATQEEVKADAETAKAEP